MIAQRSVFQLDQPMGQFWANSCPYAKARMLYCCDQNGQTFQLKWIS